MLNKIKQSKILVIGDLMLDIYLYGAAERISPEAPVPVVSAEKEESLPGGAANVMSNLAHLGCHVFGAGYIGKDETGRILWNKLNDLHINTECIVHSNLSTIHKTRVIANGQHVVRFDFDQNYEQLKEEKQNFIGLLTTLSSYHFDAIIVSDYNKGTINKNVMDTIKSVFHCPIICDTKPQHKDIFHDVWCITPNIQEAKQLFGLEAHSKTSIEIAKKLKQEMNLKTILVTMADQGVMGIDEQNNVFQYPAYVEFNEHNPKTKLDVTGAGDTLISVFAACVAGGISTQKAVLFSNIAAGIVVKKTGTAVCSFDELFSESEKYENSSS